MTGRIVVGVDGSEPSLAALRWAAKEAKASGCVLDVVTAWELPKSVALPGTSPRAREEVEAETQAALDKLLANEGLTSESDVRVTSTTLAGPAALELVERSRGATQLVVGARGRGAFTGMTLGSVSLHCVSHAHCPVVVIR